ncbi:MAG: PD-(D/E)XK nuclease family protein [Anaerolineae bacterium]
MEITGDTRWLNSYKLPFSWSYSRDQVFRVCKRQYYFRYYAPYGGDAPQEPDPRWLILVLGKLSGVSALIGSIIPTLARDTLKAARDGHPWDKATCIASARALLSRAVKQSERAVQRGQVNARQKILQTHYFGGSVNLEMLLERLDTYTLGLLDHPIYRSALAQVEQICLLDQVRRFKVDEVSVFAVPDLVLSDKLHYRVIDWKTGSSYSSHREQLGLQLGLYALYMVHTEKVGPQAITCEVAGLADASVIQWDMSDEELAKIEAYVEDSITAMQMLLTDAKMNTAGRDQMPKRTQVSPGDTECARCSYRILCFGVSPDIN